MNVYEKLQNCRVELQSMNLKKTGHNKFAGFYYYELGDFLPAINKLFKENKLSSIVTFNKEYAVLEVVNSENPEEVIEFTSPMRDLELKGCNEIQALGGIETYQRRYLYMLALEIVENDMFDATSNKDKEETKPKTQIKTTQQKPTITYDPNKTIEELHINAINKYIDENLDKNKAQEILKSKFNIPTLKDIKNIKMSDFAKVKEELKKLKGDK